MGNIWRQKNMHDRYKMPWHLDDEKNFTLGRQGEVKVA